MSKVEQDRIRAKLNLNMQVSSRELAKFILFGATSEEVPALLEKFNAQLAKGI